MNFSNLRNENQPTAFCPSDEDLIDYLLGTSVRNDQPDTQRSQMESWLALDARHGKRLEALAYSILVASNESALWASPTTVQLPVAVPAVSGRRALPRGIRVAVAIALAASVLFAATFLNSQRTDSLTDDRVAMVWADSLNLADNDETADDVAAWLLQQSPDLEGDDELDGDDSDSPGFGFDSPEPPEWLLTAVMDMQANGAAPESNEAIQ